MTIQIAISEEVWKYLNQEKEAGESFNEVLERQLKIKKQEIKK